jgi:hypothetical protein
MGSIPNYPSSRLTHLTCPSSVFNSSESCSWDGLLLEHHRIPEGERVETVADRHVLWLWTTSYSGEYAGQGGRFVRCSKGRGAITATPTGVIPTLHTYTRSEVILCALDSNFVGSILSELDRQPRTEPIIRPKFQDSAIRRLMTLLSEEVRAGVLQASYIRILSLMRSQSDTCSWVNVRTTKERIRPYPLFHPTR